MSDEARKALAARQQRLREAMALRKPVAVPRLAEPPPSSAEGDAAARNEAAGFASGDLEKKAAEREHGRTERFRDHVALAVLLLFWMGFGVLVLAALAWMINFALPLERQFLSQVQADRIITFLTGGGLTSFVSGYAKKRLS